MKRNLIISGEFTVSELKKDAQCTTAKPKTARQRIDALKAAGIDTASGVPNKNKVGSITLAQAEEIAKTKMPDLNAASLEAAVSMIKGTARSMGVTVEG